MSIFSPDDDRKSRVEKGSFSRNKSDKFPKSQDRSGIDKERWGHDGFDEIQREHKTNQRDEELEYKYRMIIEDDAVRFILPEMSG